MTDTVTGILIAIATLLIFFIGFYIYKSRSAGPAVVKSIPLTGDINAADLIYYLPMAYLQMDATATIVTQSDTSQNLLSAQLLDLVVVNTVTFVPDTDFSFGLKYQPSSYMNDEIRLTLNTSGLLDTITTTTEDRIGNLVSELTSAPAAILNPSALNAVSLTQPTAVVATVNATITRLQSFYLPLADITNPKRFPWIISIDGTSIDTITVDASFSLVFTPGIDKKYDIKSLGEQDGVLTRPLKTITMALVTNSNKVNPAIRKSYKLTVPNRESIVSVPINRSPFIKRINTPKFSSGLLLENYINKPSEFEALVAIPVNIAKALVAIPAQLFTFTLQNKNSQKIAELQMENKLLQLQKNLSTATTQPAQQQNGQKPPSNGQPGQQPGK